MSRKYIDISGKRFGRLVAIRPDHKNKYNQEFWLCDCDCGTQKLIRKGDLTSNHTYSCGCLKREQVAEEGKKSAYNLIGKRFERLTVISRAGTKGSDALWLCRCDCGNEIVTTSNIISSGHTRSCGCLRSEVMSTKMSGDENPMKCLDNRIKNSKSHIGLFAGSKHPNFGKHFSESTRKKMSEAKQNIYMGSNNPNWRGGVSFEPYCEKFNKQFRQSIREKFNNKCYLCGKTSIQNKRALSVHHIDYNKNSICKGQSWSFVPLCNEHHTKTNYNRWYWFNLMIAYWASDSEINLNMEIFL